MGGLLVLVVAAVVLFVVRGSRTSAASSDEALDDLRASAGAARPARRGLPAQGLYEVRVLGEETLSRGPVKINRDLPESSPRTIRHTRDGDIQDWRLSSDNSSVTTCRLDGEGTSTAGVETDIGALGVTFSNTRDWQPPVLRTPLNPRVGQTWSSRHADGDLMLEISREVTGRETPDSGGTLVETFVIEASLITSGDATGEGTESIWYGPVSGLQVRNILTSETSRGADPTIDYEATLVSLTPQS